MNKKKIQGNNCGLCGHNSVLSPGNHGFLSSHRRAASNGCVFARGLWSCFFSGLGPRGKMGRPSISLSSYQRARANQAVFVRLHVGLGRCNHCSFFLDAGFVSLLSCESVIVSCDSRR